MARRPSLLVRFFAISMLIAGLSIGVTAWLATQATTGSIRQEQGEALATDAKLYDRLLEYAATHPNWAGVQPTVDALARETGRRIALTTTDRKRIADSGDRDAPPLPVRQTVIVDPMRVDLTLKPGGPTDQIDPRAVGPFRLTPAERKLVNAYAVRFQACAQQYGPAELVVEQNGRTRVRVNDGRDERYYHEELTDCQGSQDRLAQTLTQSEQKAGNELTRLYTGCLGRVSPVADGPSGKPMQFTDMAPEFWKHLGPAEAACLDTARRELLARHVAPSALLFLTNRTGAAPPRADLSQAGTTRIALTALAILALAGFAAWFSAAQLTRPIQAVTSAARRMGAGDRAVRVDQVAKGEVGDLAEAFNAMSQRLADTESQRKALVSDIAHELRTPLGNITGWLEATQDGLATPDPELIGMLLKESFLLQYLVNDLQDLAQADAGTLRLHLEPLDVRDLVDQVTAAHQAAADENGVVLRAATRGQLQLTADPARLRQALGNLVANAVRYTPPGGEVTVVGRRDGENILLEVTDSGVGIAPADLPLVFDRFWRADKSRSRATGGSGLGLAITRHLAEAHGGSAAATSELGKGSTFSLRLPVTNEPPSAPPA